MNDQQRYLFDLQGFIVLKGVLPQTHVARLEASLDRLEASAEGDLPPHVAIAKPRTPEELYLANIVEAGPEFEQLIDVPDVLDVIREVSLGLFRLNHTYALYHWRGGVTPLHMGGTPIHPKAHYATSGGQIFSLLTKAVFPISNHRPEDGCFAVVPASHKAGFPLSPGGEALLVPVDAEPGDAVVFTEALTHGSLKNLSGRCRKTVFYCYSVGYMPDWTKFGLTFSNELMARVNDARHEVLRLKIT
jgi:ectoine hydroxylase-related dioxygenase (phytanoyl-CoA dioxygenase family)